LIQRSSIGDNFIDIIIPVYNSEKYISETINCLQNQSYRHFKAYFIDDKSSDNSLKILQRYKSKNIFVYNLKKNMGPAFCRNLGMRKSKNKYVCFLDADDLWHKDKLKNQIKFMIRNNLNFSYTYYKTFKSKNIFIKSIKVPSKFNFETFIKNTSIATSSIMVRRDLIKFTKFKKKGYGFDDYIFKCDLLRKKNIRLLALSEFLTFYRLNSNSISSNPIRNIYWIWNINRSYLNFNIFKNIYLVINISLNSIKKYLFKI